MSGDGAAAAAVSGMALLPLLFTMIPPIIGLCVALLVLTVFWLILFLLLTLVARVVRKIPAEHRKISPWHVYLLLIPIFNLAWNFFVYPRIAKSFQSAFHYRGDYSNGDHGETLSFVYCILVIGIFIPVFGQFMWLAAFVVWIIMLIQFYELGNKLQSFAQYGFEAGAPPHMYVQASRVPMYTQPQPMMSPQPQMYPAEGKNF